ncbi:MAG: gamma-glutamyl-gamma-aminobutyrate hydrolase family protein [Chloroflexi bacterium]|nr:gamma-glutamyl-gamma-aminobutyrate hydrolase family protein [Chloroflexota bacterium]
MSLPRIGITTSLEDGRQTLDRLYVLAVDRAGGLPVIVPTLESAEAARSFAALLDGLIITGGPGITRGLIGALPDDLPAVDKVRDLSDELIYRAMADRPFLGICYGMQFANAMAGGTIYGDVQRKCATAVHSAERGGREHEIQIEPGSRLAAILSVERLRANSHHIQAVAALGAGLRATAWAADGVVEAMESADGRVLGAQFHPERMRERGQPLFEDLIRRARAFRATQSGGSADRV